MPANPALARLVVEEHFRALSPLRRLSLALRLLTLRRPPPAGALEIPLSPHIRRDIGIESQHRRVPPNHWRPPPLY
ncbi:hypothetical protein HCZ87_08365 [Phaeobacter sp. HF9A]|nr:hypothetical protein [Phaeobacter sp. HF9A]